jgi:predicted DNA-binding transcriptional regulator AlpA
VKGDPVDPTSPRSSVEIASYRRTMDRTERERRHDERWQKEVVDGMGRMLDVLHDISDGVRRLVEADVRPIPTVTPTEPQESAQQLLSVSQLAEFLGVPQNSVRGMRASGSGPPVTKIGSRVFFHRKDIEPWLEKQREAQPDWTQPWRGAYMPGRVGSNIPRSSEPAKREWCDGSNTEPLAASRYQGRSVCRACKDDVMVNRDGRLRKHHPRWW